MVEKTVCVALSGSAAAWMQSWMQRMSLTSVSHRECQWSLSSAWFVAAHMNDSIHIGSMMANLLIPQHGQLQNVLLTLQWHSWCETVLIDNRDGSRFSNILFNYRISIRLCDYFLKVYQGLTIKTVRWREGRSDLSLARSGHCRWSLNCIICMRF